MKKTLGEFEQYLQEIHADNYHGLDDEMPDAFNTWVSELDAEEMKEYEKEWSDEIDKGFAKPLTIVLDFVERWNKQDKDKEVAEAAQVLQDILKKQKYETIKI